MRSYIITKKNEQLDWEQISPLAIDNALWGTNAGITTEARLCYDADAIYVRMRAKESQVIANETGAIGEPWQDSCMEFFFCPDPHDKNYLNIEFNPNCCLCLGVGPDRHDRIRLLLPGEKPLDAEVIRTEDGWQITYRVPTKLIRRFCPQFQAESGAMVRANFYKCGDRTPQPHFYSWNPIELADPDFHCPEYFGKLYFE